VVVIVLFNFSTREARNKFYDWQDYYITGDGRFYEENTRQYIINLTKEEIEFK
jgi:hypothetical protein